MTHTTTLRAAAAGTALALAGGLVIGLSASAAPPPPRSRAGKYMGVAQCKKCHEKGLSGRPPAKWPRLKEAATWAKDDQHAFAYMRLDDEDPPRGKSSWASKVLSEDIFDMLEEDEDSASESIRCTSCHGVVVHDYGHPKWFKKDGERSVYANEDLQLGYQAEEGISCDGCHGPASGWIKPHEKDGWVEGQWLKAGGAKDPAAASLKLWEEKGLYYSKDLVLWARQCVRCHLQIDPDLLEAEHPSLKVFELVDQNSLVPPHWRDYTKAEDRPELPGAGRFHPARMWQVGQVVALDAALQQVLKRAKADEPKPKYIKASIARARSHFVMLRHALAVFPECAEAAKALSAAMTSVAKKGGKQLVKAAKQAREALGGLDYVLARAKLTKDALNKVIAAIEADPDAKEKGQNTQLRKLSLSALKKVK